MLEGPLRKIELAVCNNDRPDKRQKLAYYQFFKNNIVRKVYYPSSDGEIVHQQSTQRLLG